MTGFFELANASFGAEQARFWGNGEKQYADLGALGDGWFARAPGDAIASSHSEIAYTFNSDAEGWTATAAAFSYDASGGFPGGAISATDGGAGIWQFVAPASLHGDRESYYGGTISLDLQRDDFPASNFPDLTLSGGGLTVVANLPTIEIDRWVSLSLPIEFGSFRLDNFSGAFATEAQIRTVLANLTSFTVRGDLGNGTDTTLLDNFVLAEPDGTEPPLALAASISEDFATDGHAWGFRGDATNTQWLPSGGNPGGYIQADDFSAGTIWYFSASQKFLGERSLFYGGTLSFDIRQSATDSQDPDPNDIILIGGGLTLSLDTANNPGTDWTSYSIDLDAAAGWTVDGVAATEAQMRLVLGDLEKMQIRGEYRVGADTGGLDNAVLTAGVTADQAGTDGDDTLATDGAGETAIGLEGNDLITTGDADSTLIGGAGDDTLTATPGSAGSAVFLIGNGGNDVLVSQAGGHTLAGGEGDDLYEVSNALTSVTISEEANQGIDTLSTPFSETLPNNFENLILRGANNNNGTGNKASNVIIGSTGNNSIDGAHGNDTLDGGPGDDTLEGGPGDDSLIGGAGDGSYRGGDGSDVLTFDGASAALLLQIEVTGGSGPVIFSDIEELIGTAFNDTVNAAAGTANSTVRGGLGDDSIVGGGNAQNLFGEDGNDTIFANTTTGFGLADGGAGDDSLVGGPGFDELIGGDGNDTVVVGAASSETVSGGAGIDVIDYSQLGEAIIFRDLGSGFEHQIGTDFNDILSNIDVDNAVHEGGGGDDQIFTDGENQTLLGGQGDDELFADDGADSLDGGVGNDLLRSYDGSDTLLGGAGVDTIFGEEGDDTVEGGAGADSMDGGAGTDTLSYATDNSGIVFDLVAGTITGGDAAGDVFTDFEKFEGGLGDDIFTGDGGNNSFLGGDGDDLLDGGAGGDLLNGGAGDADEVTYANSNAGVFVSLSQSPGWPASTPPGGGDAAGDTLIDIEYLTGSQFEAIV